VQVANDLSLEAESRVGAVLSGKWHIDRLIGVGGMAAVYEAHHRNQSRVAIKMLHRHLGLSPEQVARFQREGYAANRVGHRGVVAVRDDDVDEHGSAFLVMELLSGETVAERAAARGGTLPPEEVLRLADELLDVLIAAHARGILHRDIKPDNLFVTSEGELRVLDFGIARVSDPELGWSRTEAGTLLGSPAFIPPEQARGRIDEVDVRSDLWAVGATMFALISGHFVHEAGTPNEQFGLAMTSEARSLAELSPDIPEAVVRIVDVALAYTRERRWPDAGAMQEAVRWAREHYGELGPACAGVSPSVPGDWPGKSNRPPRGTSTAVQQASEARSSMRLLYADDGVALGEVGHVFAVIWRGEVTAPRFEAQRAGLAEVVSRHPRKAGLLCVVEPSSTGPDEKLRRASAQMLESHGDLLACAAAVIEGKGFKAAGSRSALSAITLLYARRKAPISFFSNTQAALTWMHRHVPIDSVASAARSVESIRSSLGPGGHPSTSMPNSPSPPATNATSNTPRSRK
jgi:hypothetical protein